MRDKPKAPKKPLKSEPKPGEFEWVEGCLFEKDEKYIIIFDPIPLAKKFNWDEYVEWFDYEQSEEDTAWSILNEESYHSVHRLHKSAICHIMVEAEKLCAKDFRIDTPGPDEYYIGPRGTVVIGFKIKKSTEQYLAEVSAWKNRFEIYSQAKAVYDNDLAKWQEEKKAIRKAKLQEELEKM